MLVTAGAVVAALLAFTTAGCSSSAQPDSSIGKIRPIDNGTAITVPALWAASQSDGTKVGGIEPAEVQVIENGDGQFSIDLSTIESKGAGPQWKAATSQAAAVGTLLSGADPSKVDLSFTVTGPIDGPSAGGLLTVGVLADIQGDELLPGVTMTGTISPDGSIGAVGYVPTKLAAAAAAGYTTAVIPAGLGTYSDDQGATLSLVDYGKSLGITVKEVRAVGEAYQILTGKPYAEVPTKRVVPSAQSSTAIVSTTQHMLTQLQRAYSLAPNGTDAQVLSLARDAMSIMATEIAAKKWDRAYGVGAFAYLRLARAVGAADVAQQLAKFGTARTKKLLRTSIQASLKQALAQRDLAINNVRPTVEQTIMLPGALSWATFAIATYQGLLLELAKPNSNEALTIVGRVLSEERAGVKVMLPDALEVLNAQPSVTPLTANKTTTFLSSYATLLNNAGEANLNYYAVLAGRAVAPDGQVSGDGMNGAAFALEKTAKPAVKVSNLKSALKESSQALTYFVISSGVLSGSQAYALESGSNDLRISGSPELVDAAVASGTATVESYSQKLRAQNLTVGYPLWSSRWGAAAANEYRKTELATEAGWVGLNELWYDAVSMFMMHGFGKYS